MWKEGFQHWFLGALGFSVAKFGSMHCGQPSASRSLATKTKNSQLSQFPSSLDISLKTRWGSQGYLPVLPMQEEHLSSFVSLEHLGLPSTDQKEKRNNKESFSVNPGGNYFSVPVYSPKRNTQWIIATITQTSHFHRWKFEAQRGVSNLPKISQPFNRTSTTKVSGIFLIPGPVPFFLF